MAENIIITPNQPVRTAGFYWVELLTPIGHPTQYTIVAWMPNVGWLVPGSNQVLTDQHFKKISSSPLQTPTTL